MNPATDPRPLPPNWIMRYDDNYKTHYFVDTTTNQSSWEDPRGPIPQQQQAPAPAPAPAPVQEPAQDQNATLPAYVPQGDNKGSASTDEKGNWKETKAAGEEHKPAWMQEPNNAQPTTTTGKICCFLGERGGFICEWVWGYAPGVGEIEQAYRESMDG